MGGSARRINLRQQYTFAQKINDDLLVEIFDFCRLDNIIPNTYPRNWWYTLAHVCQKWRRVLFSTPTRLGITLVCNSRTPVADMLANSPPSLPIVIYWGNPGTFDTDDSVNSALVALGDPDRVRRITLRMSESSLRLAFSQMSACFPTLETLQLCCSSYSGPKLGAITRLSEQFEAPNLRHLQLSDLKLLPPELIGTVVTRPSLVSFSIGEISMEPDELMTYLVLMPHLKVLKVGVAFSIPSEQAGRKERELCGRGDQPESAQLALTELEEFEYQGTSYYLEAIAARIGAPFLKKLSVTMTNKVDETRDLDRTTFKFFSRFISGAANLAFQYCRVRFKDGFSIVMDHDELWTGRGAFELRFNDRGYYFDPKIGLVAKICRAIAPTPSTVQSLLVEDAHRNRWHRDADRKEEWRELLRVFDNVRALRVAGRFVEELDKVLEPKPKEPDADGLLLLLPRLQEIVQHGESGKEKEKEKKKEKKEKEKEKELFAAFVQVRQFAGSPVRVVKGPQNRLTLV